MLSQHFGVGTHHIADKELVTKEQKALTDLEAQQKAEAEALND